MPFTYTPLVLSLPPLCPSCHVMRTDKVLLVKWTEKNFPIFFLFFISGEPKSHLTFSRIHQKNHSDKKKGRRWNCNMSHSVVGGDLN